MEVIVTNTRPELQPDSIKKFAKDLVLFALHMAEKISSLLRQVLEHPTKVLYGPESEVLFLPQFWFLPIYRELLNTVSRHRPSRDSELGRSASGLLCKTVDSVAGGKGKRKGKPLKQGGALAGFRSWFGSMSMMNILYMCGSLQVGVSQLWKPLRNVMRLGWRRIQSIETHRCLMTRKLPWALRHVR